MSENIVTKTCSKCKIEKPLSEFYRDKRATDGHWSCCKICNAEYARQYQQTPTGQKVLRMAYARYRKTQKGHQTQNRYKKTPKAKMRDGRYKSLHPERIKAKMAVANAIRRGKMAPAHKELCRCGKQAEAHHHYLGYTPEHYLDVIPLCRQCHDKVHNEFTMPI